MKRPVLYLLAGIVCAAFAVFLVNKYLSQRAAAGGKVKLSSILLATRGIEFGAKLDLGEKDRPGNVAMVPWPEDLVPEGAITSAEQIKGKDLVAAAAFVRHQPIQQALVQPESEFISSDSYPEPFTVERDLLGSLRAGMKVDVLKLYEDKSEKAGRTEKIIKCALIYAVGELPSAVEKPVAKQGEQPKAKEIAPIVYLLLPRKYSSVVVEARQQAKLTVRPAEGPCPAGPEATLPEEGPRPLKVAEELIKVADSLRSQARLEAAIAVYEQLVDAYAESPEAKQADKARQECDVALAEQLYSSAEEALAKKDFLACLNMCEQIEKAHPTAKETIKKLSALKEGAQKTGEERRREAAYRDLVDKLSQATEQGNLPEAKLVLAELKENYSAFMPHAALRPPSELISKSEQALNKAQTEFDDLKRLLMHFAQSKENDKAAEKFKQLKTRFPNHPALKELETDLRSKGILQD